MRERKCRGLTSSGWEYGYLVREQFRGYDSTNYFQCDNGEYLEYETVTYGVAIKYGYKIYRPHNQSSVWVKRETVGDYTGLKDKNGKEIYESDIVITKSSPIPEEVYWEGEYSFQYRLAARGDRQIDKTSLLALAKRGEVIGNIHENPELLEASNGV